MIRVEQGKGKKDRYVKLSPRLLCVLRCYWRATRPRPAFADSLYAGRYFPSFFLTNESLPLVVAVPQVVSSADATAGLHLRGFLGSQSQKDRR